MERQELIYRYSMLDAGCIEFIGFRSELSTGVGGQIQNREDGRKIRNPKFLAMDENS